MDFMHAFKRKIVDFIKKTNIIKKINYNKFVFYFLFGLKSQFGQFKININTKCLVLSQYPGAETKGLGGLIAQHPKNFEVLCLTNGSSILPLNPVESSSIKKQEFQEVMKMIRIKGSKIFDIDDKTLKNHYTTFGYVAYTPTIKGLGDAEISLLLYNQPAVTEQPQTTNGWSLNLSQNIGEKFSVFARVNEVSGSMEEIRQSWVLGGVYNNPLDRNPLDQIGLAYAYNKIDEAAVGEQISHKAEQVIEAYWAWGIGDMLTITPDVQLYINPALNQKSDYGVVTSLRATVFF